MIPDELQPSIVEILDDAGATLGTGFVVTAAGDVLTAAHVVGTRATVKIRSHDRAQTWPSRAIRRGAGDWAIVATGAPLPPIPLGKLAVRTGLVTWEAIGYANVKGNLRGAVSGTIRSQDHGVLELLCTELAPLTYDDAKGLSGAACIVDANAVGLITNVEYRNDATRKIVTGTLKALELPAELLPPRSPWQELFESAFQRCNRQVLDAVADNVQMPPEQAAGGVPHIVRFVIGGGVSRVADAVFQAATSLGPDAAIVMDAACSLWVPQPVATALCEAIANENVVLIRSESALVARDCFDRAHTHQRPGRSPWTTVVVEHEDGEDATLEAVADALGGMFGKQLDKLKLAGDTRAKFLVRLVKDAHLVVALSRPPSAALATSIRGAWPGVRVAFLFRGTSAEAGVAVLAPAADADAESTALAENEIALERTGAQRR